MPPHTPPHLAPAYHHAPPHYPPSSLPQPPAAHDTVSPSNSSSTAHDRFHGAASKSSISKSIKVKPGSSDSNITKPEGSDSSKNGAATSRGPTPKTFRFEGSISSETYKTTKTFDLAGVNILNRKPLDTRTALDKLQRRRETHNRVERKRRDCINQLIDDLTQLLPAKHLEEVTSKCHRVNVLRGAVAHIKFLSEQNTTLTRSLDLAKDEGFNTSIDLEATPSASTGKEDMPMDVDATESVKQESDDDQDEEDQLALAEKTSCRSTSVLALSSRSRSVSPKVTFSMTTPRPPVIVTNAPSPSSEKDPSLSKVRLVPPISIDNAPTDPNGPEFHQQRSNSISSCTSPSSSFSSSPMFPHTSYMASPSSLPSTFPPSPVSPSPFARQNSFSLTVNQAEGLKGSSKDQQQLSPFMQHQSCSPSPSLPPISSLANLQLQSSEERESSSVRERRPSNHPTSLQPMENGSPSVSSALSVSSNSKFGSHRSGPTLPPLKIPAQQHLHPHDHAGHAGSHESVKSSHRNSLTLSPHQSSSSPSHHHRSPDEQPPVSPFMLSPMMSRSPSMGPLSPSPGTSAYPHWRHEGTDAPPPPPPHPGHYMPGSLSPHAYPHGYHYAYPYHPSYGYPHPHGPPPPHHVNHQTHPHSTQQRPSSPQPASTRPLQPEPIFIQEEPWIVQRKRSTSAISTKNQPSSSSSSKQSNNNSSKKNQEKEEDQLTEEPPVSPSSSVASSVTYPASANRRKRSSHKGSYEDGEDIVAKSFSSSSKRAKQQQMLGADLEDGGDKDGLRQRDSGIVVVVVEADSEMSSAECSMDDKSSEQDRKQTLVATKGGNVRHKDIEMSNGKVKETEDDSNAA
ncbi:hypothetical protein BGZ58_009454 [Dissophora ornata]|nr:hypothetical protein BGZ58_009454 [Dissophora ornata]